MWATFWTQVKSLICGWVKKEKKLFQTFDQLRLKLECTRVTSISLFPEYVATCILYYVCHLLETHSYEGSECFPLLLVAAQSIGLILGLRMHYCQWQEDSFKMSMQLKVMKICRSQFLKLVYTFISPSMRKQRSFIILWREEYTSHQNHTLILFHVMRCICLRRDLSWKTEETLFLLV